MCMSVCVCLNIYVALLSVATESLFCELTISVWAPPTEWTRNTTVKIHKASVKCHTYFECRISLLCTLRCVIVAIDTMLASLSKIVCKEKNEHVCVCVFSQHPGITYHLGLVSHHLYGSRRIYFTGHFQLISDTDINGGYFMSSYSRFFPCLLFPNTLAQLLLLALELLGSFKQW